jgi:hypothetical protein
MKITEIPMSRRICVHRGQTHSAANRICVQLKPLKYVLAPAVAEALAIASVFLARKRHGNMS